MKGNSPIIITGMHRSGTTLVSKIIGGNNVFLGISKDINNESIFFQNINKWLMSINSSTWDNPNSFSDTVHTQNFKLNLDKLKLTLNGKLNFRYFGLRNYFSNNNFYNIKYNWGWKDPRNIFTLPFWIKLFPQSKVIIIIRHPIDVINSLLIREKKNINIEKNNFKRIHPYFLITLFSLNNFSNRSSMMLNSFDDGMNLYIKYFDEIKKIEKQYKKNVIIVKYEDIVRNKVDSINKILNFCRIREINQNNKLLETIKEDRVYNFNLGKQEYKKYKTMIEKCGYINM